MHVLLLLILALKVALVIGWLVYRRRLPGGKDR